MSKKQYISPKFAVVSLCSEVGILASSSKERKPSYQFQTDDGRETAPIEIEKISDHPDITDVDLGAKSSFFDEMI